MAYRARNFVSDYAFVIKRYIYLVLRGFLWNVGLWAKTSLLIWRYLLEPPAALGSAGSTRTLEEPFILHIFVLVLHYIFHKCLVAYIFFLHQLLFHNIMNQETEHIVFHDLY